jgi:hypothetical protein
VDNGCLKHRDLDRFSGVADWGFCKVEFWDLRFPGRHAMDLPPGLVNP